jgi:hypothetical protein
LEARARREKAIRAARAEYAAVNAEISRLSRIVQKCTPAAPEARRVLGKIGKPFSEMTAIQAAEAVLREGEPLRLTELTVEVMARGCRVGDDPRKVAHAIRSAMKYHKCRFVRDKAGRWGVA